MEEMLASGTSIQKLRKLKLYITGILLYILLYRFMVITQCLILPFLMTNRLKLSPVTIHTPPPELTGGHELIQPIMIEHKTLDELNSIDPYEIPVSPSHNIALPI